MWVNPLYSVDARRSVTALIAQESLATLVVADPLRAAHLPLLVESTEPDGPLVLAGHAPRADPLAEQMISGTRVLCVFHGPRAYVSPDWYGSPGLPTYNYSVAHLGGRTEAMDETSLREHLLELIRRSEAARESPTPWQPDPVALARLDSLLPAVVGFRIQVDQAQAKQKLGQNRSTGDRAGTRDQLGRSPRAEHRAVAELMSADLISAELTETGAPDHKTPDSAAETPRKRLD